MPISPADLFLIRPVFLVFVPIFLIFESFGGLPVATGRRFPTPGLISSSLLWALHNGPTIFEKFFAFFFLYNTAYQNISQKYSGYGVANNFYSY